MADTCVNCGQSTAFGSGNYVNRIPADDGWMCAECQGNFEVCEECERLFVLADEDDFQEWHYGHDCEGEIE